MPDIVCPECGHLSSFVAIRRSSDEFCPQCDYPLFWAPTAVPMATPGSTNLATLRRLPGAGGRQRVGSKVCPECGELSPLTETHCIRCGADLDPKPIPVPSPAPPSASAAATCLKSQPSELPEAAARTSARAPRGRCRRRAPCRSRGRRSGRG